MDMSDREILEEILIAEVLILAEIAKRNDQRHHFKCSQPDYIQDAVNLIVDKKSAVLSAFRARSDTPF